MEFLKGVRLVPKNLSSFGLRIEAFDSIEHVADEARGIVRRNWPHLLSMLPPEDARCRISEGTRTKFDVH
jgi:hypothetical protein